MPCGATNIPEPKLLSTLPSASNLNTTSIFLISRGAVEPSTAASRQLLAPQRSATQIDLPSRSISMALVDPIFLPSGNLAQCAMVRYGFDASLVGSFVSAIV